MKTDEEKKVQNQEEEILNPHEAEIVEGGTDQESDEAPGEKLDLSEMEDVEGGMIDKNEKQEELEKEKGAGGGVVCWC